MTENTREVENILILGNGFDLAMGRSTSYKDFLGFLKVIEFFVEYKFSEENFENRYYSMKNFEEDLEDLGIKVGSDKEIKQEFEIPFDTTLASNFLNSIWDDMKNGVKYWEFKSKGGFKNVSEKRIDIRLKYLNFSEMNHDNSFPVKFPSFKTINNLLFDNKKELAGEDEFGNSYRYWSFFSGFADNMIYSFIHKNKKELGNNWSYLESMISDLANALNDIKQHIKDYENYFSPVASELNQAIEGLKAFENRVNKDMSEVIEKISNIYSQTSISIEEFAHQSNPMAYAYMINEIKKTDGSSKPLLSIIDEVNNKLYQDLIQLTDWLEFYLTYLDEVEKEKLVLFKELGLNNIKQELAVELSKELQPTLFATIGVKEVPYPQDIDRQVCKLNKYLNNSISSEQMAKIDNLFSRDADEFSSWLDSMFLNIVFHLPNRNISKVINFNYTDTITKFGIDEKNIHFIHGRLNIDRSRFPINQMVFGIEDKESDVENISPDLIPYQKFYQRIVKETGNDYQEFFKSDNDKFILVFGHSVDPLDKEIFQNCFRLLGDYQEKNEKMIEEKDKVNYRFIFAYHSEDSKQSIVKNLAIILGKQRLVTLTSQKKIQFVKNDDREKMQAILEEWEASRKTDELEK